MNADESAQLLKEIENLLEKQIELARRGSYGKLLRLAGQCEALVAKTTEAGLREKPEYKNAHDRLARLYNDLQLLLLTQQNAAAEQIKLIRKGEKTLAAYRSNT